MSFQLALLLSLLALSSVKADGCGGLLEGDAGQLEFPIEGNGDGESNCLWIIKLISGSGVRFTLNRIGTAGVLSLYPEHESTETILNPIRLDTTAVNATVLTTGQVLVVVLAKSSSSSGVAFTWESDVTTNSPITRAANYFDTPEGRVAWTKFGQQQRLTWGLGVDPSSTLRIHTKVNFLRCDAIDPCQCAYFAVYEVTPEGYLREVTRVCGRPAESTIDQLHSQLVTFVYINSTASSSQSAEITWIASPVDAPTTTTTATTTTTTEPSSTGAPAIQLECGGILNIPNNAVTFVEYKFGESYNHNEFCMWVINSTSAPFYEISVSIESDGFESSFDGLNTYLVSYDAGSTDIQKCRFDDFPVVQNNCTHRNGHVVMTFTSDYAIRGEGFRARIETSGRINERRSLYHFSSVNGSLQYPPRGQGGYYEPSERFLAVLQFNDTNSVQFKRLSTESGYDFVSVYTIFPHRGDNDPRLDGRWSGSSVEVSLTQSEWPRIVTFSSDGSTESEGFIFEWTSGPPPTEEVLELECGGIITVKNASDIIVSYKNRRTYDDNELCIWGFALPNGDGWSSILIEVLEEGFEPRNDGLEAIHDASIASTSTDLKRCTFTNSTRFCTLNSGIGLLIFSSDQSVVGTGFKARISVEGFSTINYCTADHSVAVLEGSIKYPASSVLYYTYERHLSIIQAERIQMTLLDLETEARRDIVSIFNVHPYKLNRDPELEGSWSGTLPTGEYPTIAPRDFPRVVIFKSDSTINAAGFNISWMPPRTEQGQ